MAKKFVDAAIATLKESMSLQDGSALTLTNSVRVLYDDTLSKHDIVVLLERIVDRIRELEPQ